MVYDLEHYDEAYKYVTTHEGYYIEDLGNKTYEVKSIPPKPLPTVEEQNEVIRQTRQQLYVETSDVIRNDYLEAQARGDSNTESLKQDWLASKDKIRADNPYIGETK